MRTAIYARYSSDLQSWRVDRRSDPALQGADRARGLEPPRRSIAMRRSPGRARSARATRRCSRVCATAASTSCSLAEALDHLSRDQEDIAGLYKRLRFAGVRLITLAEGEISELHIGLKGTMNALFLRDLADKTRRGLRGRAAGRQVRGRRCLSLQGRSRFRLGSKDPCRTARRFGRDRCIPGNK